MHALLVRQMLDRIDATNAAIDQLDAAIEERLAPFAAKLARLQTIPGVGRRIAEVIIAETGGDMRRFPSPAHLASWAGLAPGLNQSAERRGSTRCRPGNAHLASAMVEAARAAARSRNTYPAAQYQRLRRRGGNIAAVAVARSLLVAAWHVLADDVDYRDLGGDYFQRRVDPKRRARHLITQLEAIGYHVSVQPAA